MIHICQNHTNIFLFEIRESHGFRPFKFFFNTPLHYTCTLLLHLRYSSPKKFMANIDHHNRKHNNGRQKWPRTVRFPKFFKISVFNRTKKNIKQFFPLWQSKIAKIAKSVIRFNNDTKLYLKPVLSITISCDTQLSSHQTFNLTHIYHDTHVSS